MLKISDLRQYVAAIQAEVPEIVKNEVVIDDSQLAKFLQDFKSKGDYIVLGIIPKHTPLGTYSTLKVDDFVSLLVLTKIDRSKKTHDEFLETFEKSQEIAKKVTDKMYADATNDDVCHFMRELVPNSLDINPIWALSSCDGYQIDFKLNSKY